MFLRHQKIPSCLVDGQPYPHHSHHVDLTGLLRPNPGTFKDPTFYYFLCIGGCHLNFDFYPLTLGFQINVRVQINKRVGKFAKNNKRTGPNKRTVKESSN